MWHITEHIFKEPLSVASNINEQTWMLLYSGVAMSYSGGFSILGLYSQQEIVSDDFAALEPVLSSDKEKYENFWMGYFSYDLKNRLEKLPKDELSFINMPELWFVKFALVAVFDHTAQKIISYASNESSIKKFEMLLKGGVASSHLVEVTSIHSNMATSEYLQNVEKFRRHILDGDIFQANLTRKFFGEIKCENPFEIFSRLCAVSPAPYSAYMKLGDAHIISSSPEKFLSISTDGGVVSLPIKGTAHRGRTRKEDEKIKLELMASTKNRAENLMIVDLMRNDFSRGSVPGSVEVSSLFRVDTYETLHHMSSKVSGMKRADVSTLQFIKNCFPPGSMTGAPKIRAMEICSETEKLSRGVYSGALGWLGGDGSADLSVVIRTLIIKNGNFEFQVGGAITSDSMPDDELGETITKAKGILEVLGIRSFP